MDMILAERRSKVDRLTSLPDHLIHHILSFLDIKHVVLTAILSRRWRALSASVPNLHFQSPANSDIEDCDFDFIRIVDRALLFNSAPNINKFQLSINYHKNYVSHVDAWVRFLMSKGIQELDLDFTTAYGRIGYKLRSWVLNCQTLTRLKLRGCGFGVYNIENYVNFTRLTSLSISHDCDDVYIDVLQDLLKGCPLLKDLVLVAIQFCRGFLLYKRPCLSSLQLKRLTIKAALYSRIDIVVPNLQMLKISARFVDKCSFEDMPLLEEAHLDIYCFSIPTANDPCEDLSFQNLGNARVLCLSSTCIQVMPIPTFKDLQFYFKTKVLTLRTGVKKYEMPGIANLLWSSPHLENLIIDLVPSKCIYEDENCLLKADFDEREYWESLTAIFPCLVHHLKTIKIIGFMGRGSLDSSIKVTSFHEKDEQIKLVRFLLKNAMVLEKMVIHVSDRPEFVKVEEWPKILLGVTQKLVAFPRASAHAEVIFSYK
ncbi:hypothetical protein MRB53_021192 [Persea americana]|uniref:Uncharacterized protein n=1 Tax=Persea americana TaxID=3435 RepID=A0ACC2L388_PERAE|nr:hypothetical protein MRB53_021192 [Persea americana]